MKDVKKIGFYAFVLMILTSVFGVVNIGVGFYRMGYAAIPMFIISGALFFVPFIFMMIEFGTGFKNFEGGIFVWMRKSVNTKFALVGIMMWYSSYAIWMFGKALSIWIPISYALFGTDLTAKSVTIGNIDMMPVILGTIAILFVFSITVLLKHGPGKFAKISAIGGIAVIALNFILIIGGVIVFAINKGTFMEPVSLSALTSSPNLAYQDIIPFLGFVVFSVFAYGGVEAMAGVSEKLQNPARDLKRGILIAAAFIVICYVIGFLSVGAIMPWADFPSSTSSLSALFEIMYSLGHSIGGHTLGNVLVRFSGFGIFATYLGAVIALMYAPLSQLISGTPKEFWPKSFQVKNENGILYNAVKAQSYLVCIIIALKSITSIINADGSAKIFELIVTMTNVGMTIPYVFLIIAWLKYRNNSKLEKDVIFFKSKSAIMFAFIATMTLVLFGNLFTIIAPFIPGDGFDLSTGIWTIVGPILFALIGLFIYNHGTKNGFSE